MGADVNADTGTGDASVAWGRDHYDAAEDAEGWLLTFARAGEATRHRDAEELVAMVADRLLDLPFNTWNFGDSVAFDALIAASDSVGEDRWIRFAHGWCRAWATRARPYARLDCTAPGRAMVELAHRFEDHQLLDACTDLAEYLVTRPTLRGVFETWEVSPLLQPYGGIALNEPGRSLLAAPPPGVFLDCLHFDPPFFAALGVVTGRDRWIEHAITQARGYVALLQKPDGSFDHFVLRGVDGSFGPGWGRGQGWAILGLLDVVESLAEAGSRWEADRHFFAESARRLISVLMATQREDGHWYAVIHDAQSGDEFSTAAFMARAFSRAVRLGVVDSSEVLESGKRARQAVLSSLDAQGQLREVSAAVYASTEPGHYGRVPRGYVVPWGQGPALLALSER